MAELAALGAFAVSGGGAGGMGSGGCADFSGSTDEAGAFAGISSAKAPRAEAISIARRPAETASHQEPGDPTVCILRIQLAPSRVVTRLTPGICVNPSRNLTPPLPNLPVTVRKGTGMGAQDWDRREGRAT